MVQAHAETQVRPRRRRRWPSAMRLALWAVNTVICLFLLAPILIVIVSSFSRDAYLTFPPRSFSLRWYENFFNSSELKDALVVSAKLALASTLVSTIVGALAALALARARHRGAEPLRALILAPLMVPGIVVGIAMLIFFSKVGIAGTFKSLLLAHIVITLPFVVLLFTAGLQAYDYSVEDAARSLGAGRLRVLLTVTVPILKGSLLAAAIFAFITSFDEVVVTLFLAGPRTSTLPVRIFQYVQYSSDPTIAAISSILVVVTIGVALVVDRFVGFTRFL